MNIVNLLNAGHGTSRMQMGNALRQFIEKGIWDTLWLQPDQIDAALAEGTRYSPVAGMLTRVPREDYEYGGVLFPAGTPIRLNMLASTRDPNVFTHPEQFDTARDPQYDLAFGHGKHYCVGHALADTEMVEAVRALTTRLTNVAVSGEPVNLPYTGMMGGTDALPIRFRRRV